MIELKNVTKRYDTFTAVRDVSFFVPEGEIVGLLGPNGAGKTTIMKMITGYHNPHSGTVKIAGKSVVEDTVFTKSQVGYLPETTPLYEDLLVYEYLQFIGRARGISSVDLGAAIDKGIQRCGISDFVYKPISSLSKGMRQRVGLAQAIIHDPAVVILDEPTSGLDPNQIKEIRKVIQELGETKTVILSTHILQEVEVLCKRVLIVNEGKIVAEGTSEEISHQLKGEDIFSLELVGNVPKETVLSLGNVEGVNKVDIVEEKDDSTKVIITGLSEYMKGEIFFDWASKERIRLRELSQKSTSLESIFEKITKQSGE